MSDKTGIEWTDSTWNPIRGCSRVSEGCRHCYAEQVAARFSGPGQPYEGLADPARSGSKWTGRVALFENVLPQPLKWKRPRRIFVNSMSDLFHENLSDDQIDRVFAVMALAPQHSFQILTKRPERMQAYMLERWQGTPAQEIAGFSIPAGGETGRRGQVEIACEPFLEMLGLVDTEQDHLWTPDGKCKAMQWNWPLPNVWLGVSVEDQKAADSRIPLLLQTPAARRFLSCEPLLGPVDLTNVKPPGSLIAEDAHGWSAIWKGNAIGRPCIDWVICGGESGRDARPMHPDWARGLRDQCSAAGVPFFFKQWGEWAPQVGAVDGWTIDDDPEISRFDHRDWEGDHWGEPYKPIWCDERADDTVSRIGKKRAGARLDGIEHKEWPA